LEIDIRFLASWIGQQATALKSMFTDLGQLKPWGETSTVPRGNISARTAAQKLGKIQKLREALIGKEYPAMAETRLAAAAKARLAKHRIAT
jgi:hypothetical protein